MPEMLCDLPKVPSSAWPGPSLHVENRPPPQPMLSLRSVGDECYASCLWRAELEGLDSPVSIGL